MNKLEQAIQLIREYIAGASPPAVAPGTTLRWGAKVSPTFKERVIWIGEDLDFDPNFLMDCIAFESGETFSPDIRNAAGSGATGLIQFMPSTARGLGTTTDQLASMSAEDQLNYVWKYFKPYAGKLRTLDDMYMAILWPSAVGKASNTVIFRGPTAATYRQNKGLDTNKDGNVTKAEACSLVRLKSTKGEQFRG